MEPLTKYPIQNQYCNVLILSERMDILKTQREDSTKKGGQKDHTKHEGTAGQGPNIQNELS